MNTVIHLDHDDMQKLLNGEEIEMPVEQTLRASENIIDISAFWAKARAFIDVGMEKRNRSVSIYFNPETGISINTYPWPDAETLWEMYQNGQITASDFRMKMGLVPVKNPEQFMKRSFLDKKLHMPKKGENNNV